MSLLELTYVVARPVFPKLTTLPGTKLDPVTVRLPVELPALAVVGLIDCKFGVPSDGSMEPGACAIGTDSWNLSGNSKSSPSPMILTSTPPVRSTPPARVHHGLPRGLTSNCKNASGETCGVRISSILSPNVTPA